MVGGRHVHHTHSYSDTYPLHARDRVVGDYMNMHIEVRRDNLRGQKVHIESALLREVLGVGRQEVFWVVYHRQIRGVWGVATEQWEIR